MKGEMKMKKHMRTIYEKEQIVKRFLNGESVIKLANEMKTDRRVIYSWINKYEKNGFDGLISQTGRKKGGSKGQGNRKPKDRIEELELELMKKEIEIARLKKGYMVKGVGAEKEFVTTFDKNTK